MSESNTSSRRDLLSAVTAAGVGMLAAQVGAAEPDARKTAGEFYEWRALRLKRGIMPGRVDGYMKEAFIPAARRAGCGSIGAFNVVVGPGNPTLHVLIPHPTIESFLTLGDRLGDDEQYKKSAAEFRALPANDPPYLSQEIQLLKAFPHVPKLEVPPAQPRIFELRTYRSHSKSAGAKKIEMFDTMGEIAIFRRLGLTPVFFAQTLTGTGLPSLTYMLTFPDLAAREKNFAAFRADPEWAKLKETPGYTDAEIVTDINNQILAPTAYSQV